MNRETGPSTPASTIPAQASSERRGTEALSLLVRWTLGVLFIYMGLTKALHPVEFLKLVRQYELVSMPLLLNAIAALLPWFEVFCGLLLIAGVAVRGSALLLLAMLAPFTVIVAHRGMALAAARGLPFCGVKFDCGCGAGEVFVCTKLLENSILILLAIWLTGWAKDRFCYRFSLLR